MSKVKDGEDVPLGQPLRMCLAQKGLKKAELVIWAMSKQSGERFVDIRLWFSGEIAGQWMPSKKGVRVPADKLPALRKLLDSQTGELILSETAVRELRGRWIEDDSGRAFDLRYFVKTASYTGWDKRGVRVREQDCPTLGQHLLAAAEQFALAGLPTSTSGAYRGIRVGQDLLNAILD